MKYYLVPEGEMRDLLIDTLTLEALDYGGVMDWNKHDPALDDFLTRAKRDYNVPDDKEFYFSDMADVNIKGYWSVEIN